MRHEQHGFIAAEWVASIACLLLPVVVVVASLPGWSERQHAGTIAAREAAIVLAEDPTGGGATAELTAIEVASRYGIGADEIDVRVEGDGVRAGTITVSVDVRMPALALPGADAIDGWTFTATQSRRVDDFRSR